MNINFTYSYDEEWGEIILSATLGEAQFEIGLSEVIDENDQPTGTFHLFSLENIGGKGSGLGRRVLEALKTWVKNQGGKEITTTPGGEYLYRMYSDVGFSPLDDGRWLASLT
jgi:hypothetical protein